MARFEDFPFWETRFGDDGRPADPAAIDRFIAEVRNKEIRDLFVFSHGWNNDPDTARDLYRRFFGEMARLFGAQVPADRAQGVGLAGVVWPSIRWPDAGSDDEPIGGAAGLGHQGAAPADNDVLFAELAKVFTAPHQRATLAELKTLLAEQTPTDAALRKFKAQLDRLVAPGAREAAGHDTLEAEGLTAGDYEEVFEALADAEVTGESEGGAAGIGDRFKKLWAGAKGGLRVATYWQMKERAGVVGKEGLGPVIGRLKQAVPDLRVHLLGHSFGARLVSFALAGLPAEALQPVSPVKSLFLLQGAFSHFAFADQLPFDTRRGGALKGMAGRVDGPLLTTFSEKDTAVGTSYPLASLASRDDAAGASDLLFRWQAMGQNGAQAVAAAVVPLGRPGTAYPLQRSRWLNLDGNQVIVHGGPPSGSHSDIVHPHTAWAALSAAGLTA